MNEHLYILVDRKPVPVDDMTEWGRFMQENDRHVAKTCIGEVLISTVFLGINHQWFDGPLLLFETMIFKGEFNDYQRRCSTWEQAETMHVNAVAKVRKSLPAWRRWQQWLENIVEPI